METNLNKKIKEEEYTFKSYYVVWKQNEEAGVGESPTPV